MEIPRFVIRNEIYPGSPQNGHTHCPCVYAFNRLRWGQVSDRRILTMSKPVKAIKCPSCQGSDVSKMEGHLAVCRTCSVSTCCVYRFCWACQREWPRGAEPNGTCSLDNCALRAALLSDQVITDYSSSARGCPFFRACPKCKALLIHDGRGCPNIVCPQCDMEFCFRCLREDCFEDSDLDEDPYEDEDPENMPCFDDAYELHDLLQWRLERYPKLCTIVSNQDCLLANGL